ncbi:Rid family hydrolase [Actinosynnema sp.]|uniref:Rid family hydrolase n=1 Tax=Actinosynnema sp. TaxID=1872144 RepID=UPI003F82FB51
MPVVDQTPTDSVPTDSAPTTARRRRPRVRTLVAAALATGLGLGAAGAAVAADMMPRPREVAYRIPALANGGVNPDPFLANGVAIGNAVATYKSAGTGPAALNSAAPAGTPARYIDYSLLTQLYPDFSPTTEQRAAGVLPAGVTVTEAQGLNAMARIRENVQAAGLDLDSVYFMRIYVEAPPGTTRGDYNGWNRAYRKYMANVSRTTGAVLPAYAPVLYANQTRPARSNLEVATLPVQGWLVEIEVEAAWSR